MPPLRLLLRAALACPFLLGSAARAATDYNGDGLCDIWQQVYNAYELVASEDDDLDGCSNEVESIAGTDPRNAMDCHKVGDLAVSANTLVFTFTAQKGKKYRVVKAAVPVTPTWTLVPGSEKVSVEDGTEDTISIVKDAGDRQFYKLEVLDNDLDSDGVSDWAEEKTGTDPSQSSSPGNASGGVASDGDTLASLFSIQTAVEPTAPTSYEKEDTKAIIHLTRSVGTMPLLLNYSVAGSTEESKGSASANDFRLRRASDNSLISGGTLQLASGEVSMDILVDALSDTRTEVPETVRLQMVRPGLGAPVQPIATEVLLADADPTLDENRTLFVAYLGREAGVTTTASGIATALVNGDNDVAEINLTFSNLGSPQNTAYLRVDSDLDITNVGLGQVVGKSWQIRAAQTKVTDQAMLNALLAGELYIDVTTEEYTSGEIRGYFNKATGSTQFTYDPLVHAAPAFVAPTGDEIERDIYRFLEQCTYGPTEALYQEVRAEVDAAPDILTGYRNWLDKQMDPGITPNASLQTLVLAADNEEFVLRGNKPITSGNDPNFGGTSTAVSYDAFGNPIVGSSNSTFNNNHPFHNNRRREQWTLALQAKAQVRQRMTQALSEICVISEADGTVRSRHYGAAAYWDTLADNAFGKYRTVLEKVTFHPMMGIYLSHLRNRAEYASGGVTISPDENYAREIMQLFSIGLIMRHPDGSLILGANGLPIPTYDNSDITELARVMTGFCHGARHRTMTVQRFNGVTFYNHTNRQVSPQIEIQGGANTAGVSFTNFEEGSGEAWFQAPWIEPMKVLGRVGSTVYHDFGAKTLLHTYNGGTVIPAQTLPSGDTQTVRAQTHAMAETDLTLAHNLLAGNSASSTYDGHSNTPINISRWLIQRFTSSNPSAGYLYRVSEIYGTTNGDLGEVLKAILLDYEARSLTLADTGVGHGRMKEPLVHFMGMLRSLGAYSGIPLTTLREVPLSFATGESPVTTPYPQTEIDKFVSLSPAVAPVPTRFRFGDYTGVLGQSPLAAPSVFNWFLPDYSVPGELSQAGLVTPEFQIATETNVVNRINRLWTFTWAPLAGTTTFPGVGVDAAVHVATSGATQVKISNVAPGTATANSFLSQRNLTFTSANWNVPQTVTVAAVDDIRPEGTHTTLIAHQSTSPDAAYNNQTHSSLTVSITDNEAAANAQIVVTESGGETLVVEGGSGGPESDTYTLRLSSAPTADVTVRLVPATTNFGTFTSDVMVSPSFMVFTSANWNVDQAATVTAVNDTTNEAPEIGLISHYVESADPLYAQANPAPVNAIVGSNDNNGSNAISILETANSTIVTEGGATDFYWVALRRAPTGTVTVAINTGSQVSASPTSLTFTAADWGAPQKVVLTAVDDSAVEGQHSQQISHNATGGGYSVTGNFTATILDNDGPGITLAQTGGNTTVVEHSPNSTSNNAVLTAGNLDTYTLVLNSQPTADVTVSVTPRVEPARMTNWAKLNGYFAGDMNNNNSDQNKDNIILHFDGLIALYKDTFAAMPGISGTPSNAQKQAAHFAATEAVVNKLDLLLATGQLKAGRPSLTLADLSDGGIIHPRKSIIRGVYSGYSTTRGNKPADEPTFTTEVQARVRVAAYLVSLSPQSIISK